MNNQLMLWFDDFQKMYESHMDLSTEIPHLFQLDDATCVIGTALNEWCTSEMAIGGLIKKQLSLYSDINFNFSEVKIKESEKTYFVCSIGTFKHTLSKESLYEKTIGKAKEVLSSGVSDEEKTNHVTRVISEALVNKKMGELYEHPFRFTAVLIKGETLKAHHMQFSFDAVFLWQNRVLSVEPLKEMFLTEKNDYPEIRSCLLAFKEGYLKRDLKLLPEFLNLFTGDEDMITIGTDAEEIFVGLEGLKNIIESDWTYWGDFTIDVKGAIVQMIGDSAYFSTKAYIHKSHTKEVMFDSSVKMATWNLEDETLSKEEKLLETLKSMTGFNHEITRGEHYYAPMRFTGYLLKREGMWLFQHIQYSDDMIFPEKRLR